MAITPIGMTIPPAQKKFMIDQTSKNGGGACEQVFLGKQNRSLNSGRPLSVNAEKHGHRGPESKAAKALSKA